MNKETAAGAFFYRPEQGKRIGLQYLKQHSLTGKITIRIIGVRFIMKKLGFGLMRLAADKRGGSEKHRSGAAEADDGRFLAGGFTYFDTAYM